MQNILIACLLNHPLNSYGFVTDLRSTLRLNQNVGIQEKGGCYLQSTPDENNITTEDRRKFLQNLSSALSIAGFASLSSSSTANAYQEAYPLQLELLDEESDLASIRNERISSQKAQSKATMDNLRQNPFQDPIKPPVFVWGAALWLLSGSRSNPLVTPVANILYDAKEEQWLKDRNEGLFASIPPALLAVLGFIFTVIGFLTDKAILFSSGGDADISLQLAGVSLIGGASLELGRIASGEKRVTREDFERTTLHRQEFQEFASKKLIPGGNCHRSEVIRSFRRYFAKYRDPETEVPEYQISDMEIERLTKEWYRVACNGEVSSAGFLSGVQINQQADITL